MQKTAYIIGTGPSLNDVDVSLLKNKDTMTFNRAYIAFEDWGFDPTYYLCIDGNDIRAMYKDINNLINNKHRIKHFFLHWLTDNQKHEAHFFQDGEYRDNENIYKLEERVYLISDNEKGQLNKPLVDDIYYDVHNQLNFLDIDLFCNVLRTSVMPNAGFMGLKMLYWMGYRKIILVGMDARYTDDKDTRIVTEYGGSYRSHNNDDPNHFRGDYFGKNMTFGKPNQSTIIDIWRNFVTKTMTKHNHDDMEIISATKDSNLNEFIKYIPFEQIINND